jgi:hypothetical protein
VGDPFGLDQVARGLDVIDRNGRILVSGIGATNTLTLVSNWAVPAK